MKRIIATMAAGGALTTAAFSAGAVGAQVPAAPIWAPATIPASSAEPSRISGVTAGGPGFIAVGGAFASGRERALVWTSEDGRSWDAVDLEGAAREGIIRAVTVTNDGLVAVGRSGGVDPRAAVWRSPDGLRWDRDADVRPAEGSMMFEVAPTPAGLVAVGAACATHCFEGRVWHSDDGEEWQAVAELPFLPWAIGVVDDTIIAAGQTIPPGAGPGAFRAVMATSVDAVRWETGTPRAQVDSSFDAVASYDGEALVAGNRFRSQARRGLLFTTDGAVHDITTSDGMALLVGPSPESFEGGEPAVVWTSDVRSY